MFVAAFLILFIASIGSLLLSVREFSQQESKATPRMPSIVFLGILAILVSALVYKSDFQYKTPAFIFMMASLLADWLYADWRIATKSRKKPKSSRRIWWQVIDNVAWVILTLVLFVS